MSKKSRRKAKARLKGTVKKGMRNKFRRKVIKKGDEG
jgi:hypothetical protein